MVMYEDVATVGRISPLPKTEDINLLIGTFSACSAFHPSILLSQYAPTAKNRRSCAGRRDTALTYPPPPVNEAAKC